MHYKNRYLIVTRTQLKPSKRSRTAEAAAAFRAAHLLHDKPVVFNDPYAIKMVGYLWRCACKNSVLHWIIFKQLIKPLRPIQGQIVARACFAEEHLEKAVKKGIKQCVIVGAGLDTLSLRRNGLSSQLKIFELDHPASKAAKIMRLKKINRIVPPNVEFIGVNFENEDIDTALRDSTYQADMPGFFSWIGVTAYLTSDAIFSTLKSITKIACSGSELVMDYIVSRKYVKKDDQKKLDTLMRYTSMFSEPLIENDFNPEGFCRLVCSLGYKLNKNLSPDGQKKSYFAERNDDLIPTSGSYFAHFNMT